jgi:hypothetical protein
MNIHKRGHFRQQESAAIIIAPGMHLFGCRGPKHGFDNHLDLFSIVLSGNTNRTMLSLG